MNLRHAFFIFTAFAIVFCISACQLNTPDLSSIRESKLLNRRIKETPRQKVMRECQQESDRFRVSCTHCHTTDKAEAIKPPESQLTEVGMRARIMRTSPTFGLNRDCASCHQSKFKLTRAAEKEFGPGGVKAPDLKELK